MTKVIEEFEHSLHSLLLNVPKIDLHCHLNGSISASLLTYLQNLHNVSANEMEHTEREQKGEISGISNDNTKTPFVKTSLSQDAISIVDPQTRMHECFKMFDLIYSVMDNLTFTKLAVQDLLFHSAMERVCVLEIRTSLRDEMRISYQLKKSTIPHRMASKEEYLQTITDTVEHLLTGHGLVCFTSGAFLHLNQITANKRKEWMAQFESIYKNSFLHNAQCMIINNNNNNDVKLCEILEKRILPHLHSHMHVRLLVSVNRAKSTAESDEAVTLAIHLQHTQVYTYYEWLRNTMEKCNTLNCAKINETNKVLEDEVKVKMQHTCWITGVDFSGNCYKNKFHDYISSLSRARHRHIKNNTHNNYEELELCNTIPPILAIALHAAEKYDDDELLEMIQFGPERFGHLVFIHDKPNLLLEHILHRGTGIELCMSSNLVTCGHTTAEQHHLGPLLQLWWNSTAINKEKCNECDSKELEYNGERERDSETDICEKEEKHDVYSITSILLSDEGYNNSKQLRLTHRLAWWRNYEERELQQEEQIKELEKAEIDETTFNVDPIRYRRLTFTESNHETNYSIPNISFHTDDRGVFDISLTSELGLICSHPLFCGNRNDYENCCNWNSNRNNAKEELEECVKVISRLERLTLVQVFELPWPVLYLTYLALSINDSNNKDDTETQNKCLSSFAHFVRMCNTLFYNRSSRSSSSNRDEFETIMTCMSQWELRWLSDNFDSLLEECQLSI